MDSREWQTPDRIEQRYQNALLGLFRQFTDYLRDFGLTDPNDFVKMLTTFSETDYFAEFTHSAASRMATGLMIDDASNWREAAKESTRGRELYANLRTELSGPIGPIVESVILRNAQLIKSFPSTIAPMVAKFVKEESEKGRRASSVAQDLIEQFPEVAKGRLKLIARTETSKASTALTKARSEEFGWSWYVWHARKDVRTRRSHQLMDTVLCNWSDPPNPEAMAGQSKSYGTYGPGEIFNCRCYPSPIVRVEHVKWPAKVHTSGRINYMTKTEFLRFSGLEERRAA
jgi:hypothetical protein